MYNVSYISDHLACYNTNKLFLDIANVPEENAVLGLATT